MRTLISWRRLTSALIVALSVASALQAQAPALSKEYIRLGGRILAIEVQSAPPVYDVAPVYESFTYLTAPSGPPNAPPATGWVVVGAGDFDRNGVPDLVYMNTSTREVTVNYYGGAGGATMIGWAWLNTAGEPAGWTIVGVADMNGDGVPDLIWQNAGANEVTVNYYGGAGGAVYQGWNWLDQNSYPGWAVVGAADFDGNGTPDLVWQNQSSEQVTVHYYSLVGGVPTYTGWNWLDKNNDSGWAVRGVADMNGDSVPDLIWEDISTGQATVHYFGGAGGAVDEGWEWFRNGAGSAGWLIVAVADFNGNGEPDLVWQQSASPNAVTVNYYGLE